tara:strand:+ start:457 stop:678 length:222 start_codon:yes stop_codon:yes gene_type:complete
MKTDEDYFNAIAASVESTQAVSRKTAARLLDCHPSFIDTLSARGEITKLTLGPHCKRITLKSINGFLARAASK